MDVAVLEFGPAQSPGEGELFEALRQGSNAAFDALVHRYHPAMLALALAYTPDDREAASGLVRHAWEIALPGLDMFEWRCSLRAWVTGILAGVGRPHAAQPSSPSISRTPPPGGVRGPSDWQDLPWGERWSGQAWELARAAVTALPLPEREVLVLAAIAGWDPREVCDALGLTEAHYSALFEAAHRGVHDLLATWLGEDPSAVPANLRARRVGPVKQLLADLAPEDAQPARLDEVFRRWRSARRRARLAAVLRRLAPR